MEYKITQIKPGIKFTIENENYVVKVIMTWIKKEVENYNNMPKNL